VHRCAGAPATETVTERYVRNSRYMYRRDAPLCHRPSGASESRRQERLKIIATLCMVSPGSNMGNDTDLQEEEDPLEQRRTSSVKGKRSGEKHKSEIVLCVSPR
jgi:hypothetical protein